METVEDYLGDGVYAKRDRTGLVSITRERPDNEATRIYLEPTVLLALVQFHLRTATLLQRQIFRKALADV